MYDMKAAHLVNNEVPLVDKLKIITSYPVFAASCVDDFVKNHDTIKLNLLDSILSLTRPKKLRFFFIYNPCIEKIDEEKSLFTLSDDSGSHTTNWYDIKKEEFLSPDDFILNKKESIYRVLLTNDSFHGENYISYVEKSRRPIKEKSSLLDKLSNQFPSLEPVPTN